MDLRDLEQTLNERSLAAKYVSTDEAEYIDVAILVDDVEEPVVVQIAPVDLTGPGLDDIDMVQLFAAVPIELEPDQFAHATSLLVAVNAKVPLGAFSVLDNPPVVYLRHVMLLPQTDDAPGIVAEAVWLVNYGLDLHLGTLIPT